LHRDLEFHVDPTYAQFLTPDHEATLVQLAKTLDEYVGFSPVAQDANGFQATYNYFRRAGADWNPTNAWDTTSVRLGLSEAANLKPEDRAHADTYIFSPSRGLLQDGQQPSDFFTDTEDVTSWRAVEDIRHENSMMFKGPVDGAFLDPQGTGWTRPRQPYQTFFYHELQHSLPPEDGQGVDLMTELWSAGAEAVAGQYDTPRFDFPYTTNLLSSYLARTGFMAYLAYQFLNADASRTLSGMRDDLLFKWNRSRAKLTGGYRWYWLEGLGQMLSDDSCFTCAGKSYFTQTGGPLSVPERIARVHHNWRVAMFADNPAIAEGQFGYPAWSGFSPAVTLGAWQDVDASASNADAMPSIVTVGSFEKNHVRVLEGTRTVQGLPAPMQLSELGAQYWVIRAGADVQDATRRLVMRVVPRGWAAIPSGTFANCRNDLNGGYIQASAISYSQPDTSVAEETFLWRKPQWITTVSPASLTAVDTLGAELEVVVPNFGANTKAVALVLTYEDGLFNKWRGRNELVNNVLPYRLELELLPVTGAGNSATPVTTIPALTEGGLVWSALGDTLAFHRKDPSGNGRTQIHKQSVAPGASAQLMRAQSNFDQFYPDWSPRGDLVVFEARDPGSSLQSDLYTTHPTGAGALVRLTQHVGCETVPSFQPDGQGLAYLRYPGSGSDWELRWVARDGTGDRLVTTLGPVIDQLHVPRWSRDGQRIQFVLASQGGRIASISKYGGAWTTMGTSPTDVKHFELHPGAGPLLASIRTSLPNVIDASNNCVLPLPTPDFVVGLIGLVDTLVMPPIVSVQKNTRAASVEGLRFSPSGAEIGYTGYSFDGNSRIHRAKLTSFSPPAFVSLGDKAATAGIPYSFSWTVGNSGGGPLSYEAYGMPYGATQPTNTSFEWASPVEGTYYIVFRVINDKGLAAAKVVKLSVIEPNCEPLCGGPPIDGGVSSRRAPEMAAARTSSEPGFSEHNSFLEGSDFETWSRQVASVSLGAAAQGGTATIHLSTASASGVELDRIRLRIHDGDGTDRIWAGETGIATGTEEAASSVLGPEGTAVLTAGATEAGHVMDEGASVEALWTASPNMRGLLVDCSRGPDGGSSGLLVQVPDGQGWRTIGRVQPRWGRDVVALSGVYSERVRLIADQSTILHRISRVVWQPGDGSAQTSVFDPAGDGPGGIDFALATEDGQGITVDAEHTATVQFELPALAPGATRKAFLELTAKRIVGQASARSEAPVLEAQPEVGFALSPVRPNPALVRATLAFSLPTRSEVRVAVHDLHGARVRTLAQEEMSAGSHTLIWDGLDDRGTKARAGTYFVRMSAGAGVATRRFVYLR